MSLDNYVLSAGKVMKRIKEAVRLFNTIKPHTHYQRLRLLNPIAKRTGTPNLHLLITTIPQTRSPENPEYLVIATYISREKVVQRQDFVMRVEYVMRLLRKLMSVNGGKWHVFMYFIGEVLRAGVYEEAKYTRALLKDRGLDINLRLIEARYGGDLLSTIYDDLLRYLGSRAYRILSSGSFSRSDGRVFGRLKHLLDYIIAVLTSLRDGEKGLLRIEDVMRKHEVSVNEYLDILRELGYEAVRKRLRTATEVKPQPQVYLPAIRLARQSMSEGEDEEEGYEVIEDRYEVIYEDYERL